MNIVGKRVVLRAIEREDLLKLQQWANDPEVQQALSGWHFPTSMEDQQKWFSSLSCTSINQRFMIESSDLGAIGTINLVSIDWKNRNAFCGFMLGEKTCHGKGYGTDAMMAIMRYAFDEIGLARLDGDMVENNSHSLHVCTKKCGWIVEGRKSHGYFRQGKYWDKIIMGITSHQYHSFVERTGYWSC